MSDLSAAVVGPDGVTAQRVLKVVATRSDGREVYGSVALAATAPDDASGGQSEIILSASRLLFVPEDDPDAAPAQALSVGLVDGVLTLRVPAAVIGDATIGTRKIAANAAARLVGTTVNYWSVASVAFTIGADEIPAGESTVPVLVIASQDVTASTYFDVAINSSGWGVAGNLLASQPGGGAWASTHVLHLGAGTHTVACYNHVSSTPQYDWQTRVRTIAALIKVR